MDVELGAGDQGGRHDERCRRGEVARDLDLAEREPLGRAHGDARRPDGDVCAGRLQHALGVVAGRGRLDDRRLAVREEPGEQDRRLDLRARDGQRVVDRVERVPGDRHRQVAVRRLEASAHAAERLGDPTHRPPRERLVARQLEALTVLSGEDAGDQPDERPGVRAVDRPPRRAQPTEALPEHAERVGAVLVDVDPEGAHRRDRRLGVRGAAEARDVRLAVADRADQHRAVRDRLVARNRDVADEPRDGLDEERSESGGHSSITGAATTP